MTASAVDQQRALEQGKVGTGSGAVLSDPCDPSRSGTVAEPVITPEIPLNRDW